MAYDEALAERVRDVLAAEGAVTERRMFGGLAFLVGGHMAVAVDPDADEVAAWVDRGATAARALPPKP